MLATRDAASPPPPRTAPGRLARASTPEAREEAGLMSRLAEIGWGKPNDAWRQFFTTQSRACTVYFSETPVHTCPIFGHEGGLACADVHGS